MHRVPSSINPLREACSSPAIRRDINAANLIIHKTQNPKNKLPLSSLKFGDTFTDHLLEVNFTEQGGWDDPVIRPYGPISLDPASAVFHYGLECFEGMKAYKDQRNRIRLFRPDMNMKRMNQSMSRLSLPTFDGDQLLKCLNELLKVDQDWIPKQDGYSLYIRPTGISTDAHIGVRKSRSAKIFIICSPVGPYYPEGFAPVKLFANDQYVRAWPGGMGAYKVGGNYASGILPQAEAAEKGYAQNLWIFGEDDYVTEVGTMNFFMHWINEDGLEELVTPPLTRGDILPGITRDSIISLVRESEKFPVREGNIKMQDLSSAVKEGRLFEAFGSGTAAIITPISVIHYKGEDLYIPLNGKDGQAGKLAERLWKQIIDIQYGRVTHPWSIVVE
ncbi:unnamed protein product [Albugo candida]|uniref:Branched-chain-amino-acid aminotransferase n=1 Tax=Albugo candida TaxID=65357 RepID=A0A024FVA5_9STRA|nr:unnamed protein product [Albugo candida]|eukprot:CCI10857.1 unnamed protein product [Albugo candida]